MVGLKIEIPSGFLDEEVRCGYTVSKKMKEIWAVELDLFAEFDRVCRKHGISYVASGGTMLGAVRNHGFIPWDDDMDLMMMRDEYERLCQVAQQEFTHPYFFQTARTDCGVRRMFARLRNSETTAMQEIESQYYPKWNQGIFIDIFPLDNVADRSEDYRKEMETFLHKRILFSRVNAIENGIVSDECKPWKQQTKKLLHHLLGRLMHAAGITQHYYKKAEEVAMRYNDEDTEFVSLLTFQFDNLGHALRRTDMGRIIDMDFEFAKMPVIANYDEHLTRKYGDYMTPKIVPNYHGGVLFDTSRSYKEYLI